MVARRTTQAATALVLGRNALAEDFAAGLAAGGAFDRVVGVWTGERSGKRRSAPCIDVLGRGAASSMAALLGEVAPVLIANLATSESPVTPAAPWIYDQALAETVSDAVARWRRRGGRARATMMLSSTAVYGVARSAPLLFGEAFEGEPDEPDPDAPMALWGRGLRAAEAVFRSGAADAGCPACVLRAAHVVCGPMSGPVVEYLRSRAPVRVLGYDPPVQVIHYEDLLAALLAAAEQRVDAVLNVVGRNSPALSRLVAAAGVAAPPLPGPIADRMVAPAFGASRLRWRCIADGSRAKQLLGLAPSKNVEEELRG